MHAPPLPAAPLPAARAGSDGAAPVHPAGPGARTAFCRALLARSGGRAASVDPGPPLPDSIRFLSEQGFDRTRLARAAECAQVWGCDASDALLGAGLIDEEGFYRALARALRVPFLDAFAFDAGARHPLVLEVGAAPLAPGAGARVVAAPRAAAVARLIAGAGRIDGLAITTPTRLRGAAFARYGGAIAQAASEALHRARPDWSCRPGPGAGTLALLALALALLLGLTHLPGPFALALTALVQAAILAALALRLASALAPRRDAPVPLLPDRLLPTYTVLVALHREAAVVPRLIHTLSRLDYPAGKLDIKFLIEADDAATAAALRAAPLPARFEVLVVPPGLPRTKPRALNAALPLARGDLLVVYDAEDVVDPGQLRLAASRFARAAPDVACLQGHLVIDNVADSWLTRLFALEYAALFEVLVPALAAWGLPIPLGGTSTHLRTRVLRDLHGWDAWNVTEDADLGLRLALAGYRVDDLPSPTFEEAPRSLSPWLAQRTRWMKGFLQTSLTHGRRPVTSFRRLGLMGSLAALALVPGTVLSALLYPVLTLAALLDLALGAPRGEGPLAALTGAGSVAVLGLGLVAILVPAALGCLRRDWPGGLAFVLLMPLYLGLMSVAAWLAVRELVRHPHRWNKTEHGMSRTSRSGALQLRPRSAARPAVGADPRVRRDAGPRSRG